MAANMIGCKKRIIKTDRLIILQEQVDMQMMGGKHMKDFLELAGQRYSERYFDDSRNSAHSVQPAWDSRNRYRT